MLSSSPISSASNSPVVKKRRKTPSLQKLIDDWQNKVTPELIDRYKTWILLTLKQYLRVSHRTKLHRLSCSFQRQWLRQWHRSIVPLQTRCNFDWFGGWWQQFKKSYSNCMYAECSSTISYTFSNGKQSQVQIQWQIQLTLLKCKHGINNILTNWYLSSALKTILTWMIKLDQLHCTCQQMHWTLKKCEYPEQEFICKIILTPLNQDTKTKQWSKLHN